MLKNIINYSRSGVVDKDTLMIIDLHISIYIVLVKEFYNIYTPNLITAGKNG